MYAIPILILLYKILFLLLGKYCRYLFYYRSVNLMSKIAFRYSYKAVCLSITKTLHWLIVLLLH